MLIGAWRGIVGEIIALFAWIVAFLAAREFGEQVGEILFITQITEMPVRTFAGWITVFIAVLILLALARHLIRATIRALGLTPLDRFAGFCFGLVRGMLIVLVLVAIGGMTSLPKEYWWRDALFSPPLEIAVLAFSHYLPDTLAERIRFK